MNENIIYSGFVPLTISQLHAALPIFFNEMGLLITCLDSNPNPVGLSHWKSKLSLVGIQVQPIGTAAWIDKEGVQALFANGTTFYGFDEAYLLAKRPNPDFSPRGIYTAERLQLTGRPPSELIDNMHALNALRYISDGTGIGLNFICESPSLRERVLNAKSPP